MAQDFELNPELANVIDEQSNSELLAQAQGDAGFSSTTTSGADQDQDNGSGLLWPIVGGLLGLGAIAAAAGGGGGNTTTVVGAGTGALDTDPIYDTGVVGDNKTTNSTPKISGTATPNSQVEVTLNGKVYSATVGADGKYSVIVPATDKLPDGTYTPKVKVTPPGGTPSTTDGTPFTIDTTTNVAISSKVRATSTDQISGTSEPGNIVTLKDVNGAVIGSALTDSNGNWTVIPKTAVPEGKITAETKDASNNTASASATASNSTTAALADASDSGTKGDNKTNDTTPSLTGKATPGAKVEITINGKPYTGTADANGDYIITVPDADKLPDGTYTPKITETPPNGNPTTKDGTPFVIDTQTNVSIANPGAGGTTQPITGKAEAGDVVTLKDANGNPIGSTTADSAGNWSITPTTPVPAGKITADAKDAAGNTASGTGVNNAVLPNGGEKLGLTIDTDANNDGFVNFAEMGNVNGTPNATLTVTATFDKTKVSVGDVVTFTDTNTGTVKTVVLTAADLANGKVSTTFVGQGDGTTFAVKAVLKDAANSVTPDATDTAKLDLSNLDPKAPVVYDPITNPSGKKPATVEITTDSNNDGVLNATELAGGTKADVKIGLPTDAKVGDSLVVTGTGNAAQTIILTQSDINNGYVMTQLNTPANGSKLDVTAKISDIAGNSSATATDAATVNTTPASAPSVKITTDVNNDGFANKDELGSSPTITVETTLPPGSAVGDTITVTDGTNTRTHTLTAADVAAGKVTDTLPRPAEGATVTVSATRTPAGGGATSPAGTDSVKVDTSNFSDPADVTKSALKVQIDTDTNNDGVLNIAELNTASSKIQATVTLPATASVGDTVTITASGNVDRVITLTAAQVAAGKIIITDFNPTGDNTTFTVTAAIKDQAGNTSPSPAANDSAAVKTSVTNEPTVSIVEDTNNDGTITGDELKGNVDVTITLPGGAKAGDVLNINVNGQIENYTLTTADVQRNSVSRTVPPPANGSSVVVKATLTDTFNNVSKEGSDSALMNTTIDPTNANATVLVTAISNDSGVSASDFYTNDNGLIYRGTVGGFTSNGDVVFLQLKDNNGIVIASTTVTPSNGTWEWDNNGVTRPDGNYTLVATITDKTGTVRRNVNAGGTDDQILTIDTSQGTNSDPSNPTNKVVTDPNNSASINIDSISLDTGVNTTDFITSDSTLVYNGKVTGWTSNGDQVLLELKNFDGSAVLASVLVTPDSSGNWTWDNSSVARAIGEYQLVSTIVDKAGNKLVPTDTQKITITGPNGGKALGVNIDTDLNNDGFVNFAEMGDVNGVSKTLLTVTTTFDKTQVFVGDVITVTDVNTGVTQTVTLTAADIAAGKVVTTFTSPGDGKEFKVKAVLKDANNNVTPDGTDVANLDLSNLDPKVPVKYDPITNPSGKKPATVKIVTDTNNDGIINAAEAGTATEADVEVGLPSDAKAGDVLLVTGTGSDAQSIPLTQADIDAGKKTVKVKLPPNGSKLDVTAKITDVAGNSSSTATDNATVDTTPATAPSVEVTTDTNNDGYINKGELGGGNTVNVKTKLPPGSAVGDVIEVTDGTTTKTHTLTQADLDNGSITDTFPAPAEGGSATYSATRTPSGGGAKSPAGTDTIKVDTSNFADPVDNTKTAVKIIIDTDANNDGLISAAELSNTGNQVNATVKLPAAAAVGDTVTVHASGNNDRTYTLTAEDIAAGQIIVTGLTATSDNTTFNVSASIKDQAGNTSPTPDASDTATIKTSVTGAPIITISEDSNNDGIISASEFTAPIGLSVALPVGAVVGDKITVTVNNVVIAVVTLDAANLQAGAISLTTTAPAEGGTIVAKATLTDKAQNVSPESIDIAVMDTTAPNGGTAPTVSIITDVNNDAYVNASELNGSANFIIKGSFNKALVKEGDTLTFTSGGVSKSVVLTANDIVNGFATTTFPKPSEGTALSVVAQLRDEAGNSTAVSASDSATLDSTTPTIAISRTTGNVLGANGVETITFTLSEASTDFTLADIDVSTGSLSNLTTTDNIHYTALYTPASNSQGVATIGVVAGKFKDAAGNLNTDTYVAGQGANSQADNQVSVSFDTKAPDQTVSFSSMTKDSSTAGINSDWLTADSSAGRLVSGTVSATLSAGEFIEIYADKGNGPVLLGTATVAAGGNAWVFTDTNDYTGANGGTNGNLGWTYSAKVVDGSNNSGSISTQVVTGDYTEGAPRITGVKANTLMGIFDDVANGATTADTLKSVSGTGKSGDIVYLYDNTGTNLVGSTTVASDGTWTVSPLNGIYNGSNTFAAKQVDPLGNESSLSNLWTVNAPGNNLMNNGDFTQGNTGFGTDLSYYSAGNPLAGTTNQFNIMPQTSIGSQAISSANAATGASTAPASYTFGTWTKKTLANSTGNPDGAMGGNVLIGQVSTVGLNNLWTESVSVVAGKTYTFTVDYVTRVFDTVAMQLIIDGATVSFTSKNAIETGHLTVTYTAPTSKTIALTMQGSHSSAAGGDFVFDNFKFVDTSAAPANSLVEGGTPPATPNPDTGLTYITGTLDSLAGNDIITATSTGIQAKLASGGFIDGGAGVDNLKLAAGTVLNLESLTSNQTVKTIQEVEIITMQGGSSALTMSANDVLSLGGSNATTMSAYSFSSTSQGTSGTSSTGKVQFVVNGQSGDVLNLDVLANDGVSGNAGVLGNTGLSGTWVYKGNVTISAANSADGVAHTYKVFDHSTTKGQVLVEVAVTVNTGAPITINAISSDAGDSNSDFLTNDQTLIYTGQVPAAFSSSSHRVFVEILDSNNAVVRSGFATVSGSTWTWDNQASSLGEGNYTIRSTIVGTSNTTAVSSFGTFGQATHAMTIDTTTPTVAITRASNNTLGAGGTEIITFTLSEASTDFTLADIDVSAGSLGSLSTTDNIHYTAIYSPAANAQGTATIGVASAKFKDAAGNSNADTYVAGNGTNTQANNQVSVVYDTQAPDQTVFFSSMTKDSSPAGLNHDWLTADSSAGRLVSGTVSKALAAGETVEIYVDKGTGPVLLGTATVVAGGTSWVFTDTTDYAGAIGATNGSSGWTYSARVVDAQRNTGVFSTQQVLGDYAENAPKITIVTDSTNASIGNSGSTNNSLSTVGGTGNAGDIIYLYDNSSNNLVGTTTVGSNGMWTVSGLNVGAGSNTFSARQMDALGNQSDLSNLWTVNAGSQQLINNGGFESSSTQTVGFTTNGTYYHGANFYNHVDTWDIGSAGGTVKATNQVSNGNTYAFGTWSKSFFADVANPSIGNGNPNGAMTGNRLWFTVGTDNMTVYSTQVSVVKGTTYTFKFDYSQSWMSTRAMWVVIDGVEVQVATNHYEAGQFTATYTATSTKVFNLAVMGSNGTWLATPYGTYVGNWSAGDMLLDNFSFIAQAPTSDNSLVAGGTPPATPNPDTGLTYTTGILDSLAGNDIITATSTGLQATLAAGGYINGSEGADTLKLAAGTNLNLTSLTSNQTVKSIQEIEIFQLQGSSTLTVSANDVLSLGGANSSTMSAFSFSSTSGGTGSTSSTGKVQFVVNATGSDTVNLDTLTTDGVGGNAGLSGAWNYMGTTSTNGTTYKVYNHSTTEAQVLVSSSTPVATIASPLALDLNGDGVNTLNHDSGVNFDVYNIGSAQHTGWIDQNDGLLVMDLNHDGIVNSGAELLGTSTRLADGSLAKDGWEALAQYDSNNDGIISAKDNAYTSLNVWVDANIDGITDAGELKSLLDLGIQSINLNHDNNTVAQNGNVLQGFSNFTTTDGQNHQIVDAWFKTSTSAVDPVNQVLLDQQLMQHNI